MDRSTEDRKRKRTESPEGVSKPVVSIDAAFNADLHQATAKHRDHPKETARANLIRVRRVFEASLRQYGQLMEDFYSRVPTPSSSPARAADTVNSDHLHSSNDPLEPPNPNVLHRDIETISNHGEHVASSSGKAESGGEQSMDNPSDEDDGDEDPAWLEFLRINTDFILHRQQYTEALEEAGMNELPEGNWQDTFEGIRTSAVIMFQSCGPAKASDPLDDEDLWWSPTPFGPMRTTMRFAIVTMIAGEVLLARDLTTFEDIPTSPKRGQQVPHYMTGEMRFELEEYVHVVALDSDGPIRPEPECFKGGVQCDWRSTNNASPPSNKNWFARVDWPRSMRIENGPVCVVGELAKKKDLEILRLVNQAVRDDFDREWAQEFQLPDAESLGNDSG